MSDTKAEGLVPTMKERQVTTQPKGPPPPDQGERALGLSIQQTNEFNRKHVLTGKILNGYKDGGRFVNFKEDGKPVDPSKLDREIVVVDQGEDQGLQSLVNQAKKLGEGGLSEREKIANLMELVNNKMGNPNAAQLIKDRYEKPGAMDKGKEVLLGSIDAGVCRHRALLFQVLASEAGLHSNLRRGYLDSTRQLTFLGREIRLRTTEGVHTWNEVVSSDGKVQLVDTMHPSGQEETRKLTYHSLDNPQKEIVYSQEVAIAEPDEPPESVITKPPEFIDHIYQQEEREENGEKFVILKDKQGGEVLKVPITENGQDSILYKDGKNQILYMKGDYEERDTNQRDRYTSQEGEEKYFYDVVRDSETGELLMVDKVAEGYKEKAADVIIRLPSDVSKDDMEKEVERLVRVLEPTGEVPEGYKDALRAALEASRNPANEALFSVEEMDDIMKEAGKRLDLAEIAMLLGNKDLKGAGEKMKLFGDSGFNYFQNEWKYSAQLREVITEMEGQHGTNDFGAYFRERNQAGPARAAVDAKLAALFPIPGGPAAVDEEISIKRKVVRGVAERLFKISGMATYYSGPKEIIEGIERVRDEVIFDKVDDKRLPPDENTRGRGRYFDNPDFLVLELRKKYRNELYKINYKANPNSPKFLGRPERTPVLDTYQSEEAEALNRILYLAESTDSKGDRGIGKARSLRKDMETGILSLVHTNGYRRLSEYIEGIPQGIRRGRIGMEDWGESFVAKSAESIGETYKLLDQPVLGPIGDGSKLGDNIKQLNELLGKTAGALIKADEVKNYISSRYIESVIGYLQGDAKDRVDEFGEVEKLKPSTKRTIVANLGGYMNHAYLMETYKAVNATLFRLNLWDIFKEHPKIWGAVFWSIITQFFGAIGLKSGK